MNISDELRVSPKRAQSAGEELANTISHGIGLCAALIGVTLKATRGPSRHSKLGMTLYLGTGWLALIAIRPITLAIPPTTLFWLVTGGVAYTTGVVFFVNQRLRYSHFIWHLFVLAGTGCHFLALLSCCAS